MLSEPLAWVRTTLPGLEKFRFWSRGVSLRGFVQLRRSLDVLTAVPEQGAVRFGLHQRVEQVKGPVVIDRGGVAIGGSVIAAQQDR